MPKKKAPRDEYAWRRMTAARKLAAADRHEKQAAKWRIEAAELDAEAEEIKATRTVPAA